MRKSSRIQSETNSSFFSITIDQLKGLEPIPKFDNITKLPLITWAEARLWNEQFTTNTNEHVITEINASYRAYALRVLDGAMEPIFPRGTVLTADPAIFPKDKSYVITLTHGIFIPIFRQLIINGDERHLKALSPDTDIYKMLQLVNLDSILATVIQASWNYMS